MPTTLSSKTSTELSRGPTTSKNILCENNYPTYIKEEPSSPPTEDSLPSIADISDNCSTERSLHFDPVRPNKSSRYDAQKVTVLKHNNKGKRRVYDKRDACLYCGKFCSKLVEHLQLVHSDKKEVEKIFKLRKNSKGRRASIQTIRKKGNFLHNKNVLNNKTGVLLTTKRPSSRIDSCEYLPCEKCLGFYRKTGLARHHKLCLDSNEPLENINIEMEAVADKVNS